MADDSGEGMWTLRPSHSWRLNVAVTPALRPISFRPESAHMLKEPSAGQSKKNISLCHCGEKHVVCSVQGSDQH